MFLFAGRNKRTSSSRAAGRKDAATLRVVIGERDPRTRLPSDVDFKANVVDRARFNLVDLALRVFVQVVRVRDESSVVERSMNTVWNIRVVVYHRGSIFEFGLYPNRLIDGRRGRGRDRREKQGHDAT